jgi:hypothetical protein
MKNYGRLPVVLLCVVLVMLALTCKDQISGPELSQIVFPAKNVSYHNHVQPLFDRGCGGQSSACHGSDTFNDQNPFALDVYEHAVNPYSRFWILPGDPDHSNMNHEVEQKPPVMPPRGQPQLSANQIKGLRQWVLEGAQNN